ncbi:MAG: hypothetical protein JO347_00410 [Candidatus Eremiobacteraeota bacterium]|nr:hypothetical protein [Candidatus Eremiobacteraeota bacterium]MBV8280509.1 hypothetical protein [Candidatus Eremiobacteraeota bacterium]
MDILRMVEDAMRAARYRQAVLASDAANATSAGFAPKDIALSVQRESGGMRFAAAIRDVPVTGAVATVEYAMGAIAKNAVWYRALAQQTRAILREFRTVAEEARR